MTTQTSEVRKSNSRTGAKTPGAVRRLRQLVICLVLFGLVLAGRGLDLGPISRLSAFVGQMVQTDTDFQAVFAQAGAAFSDKIPAMKALPSFRLNEKQTHHGSDPEASDLEREGIYEDHSKTCT